MCTTINNAIALLRAAARVYRNGRDISSTIDAIVIFEDGELALLSSNGALSSFKAVGNCLDVTGTVGSMGLLTSFNIREYNENNKVRIAAFVLATTGQTILVY